jgi:hypothetical protein
MSESVNLLMREFLTWIASRRRTYDEAMNAWQSTCPRHTIWEDALIEGYVQVQRQHDARDPEVALTARGIALLNGNNSHDQSAVKDSL